jgi:hypothetical protein
VKSLFHRIDWAAALGDHTKRETFPELIVERQANGDLLNLQFLGSGDLFQCAAIITIPRPILGLDIWLARDRWESDAVELSAGAVTDALTALVMEMQNACRLCGCELPRFRKASLLRPYTNAQVISPPSASDIRPYADSMRFANVIAHAAYRLCGPYKNIIGTAVIVSTAPNKKNMGDSFMSGDAPIKPTPATNSRAASTKLIRGELA